MVQDSFVFVEEKKVKIFHRGEDKYQNCLVTLIQIQKTMVQLSLGDIREK